MALKILKLAIFINTTSSSSVLFYSAKFSLYCILRWIGLCKNMLITSPFTMESMISSCKARFLISSIWQFQERGLATLRHLCVGHAHQTEAQKAVLQQEFAADFLLRKLTEMRPSILKQTLQVIC